MRNALIDFTKVSQVLQTNHSGIQSLKILNGSQFGSLPTNTETQLNENLGLGQENYSFFLGHK